jgi:transcription termination factor NusB
MSDKNYSQKKKDKQLRGHMGGKSARGRERECLFVCLFVWLLTNSIMLQIIQNFKKRKIQFEGIV